jgi:wyosine [tRNA(Phe)-imidazoG37] synthetase (radical SAM superfamily)
MNTNDLLSTASTSSFGGRVASSTILFDSIVFGPIHSRRLGRSLGINLLPTDGKWCNYNCIYCECGWNTPFVQKPILPTFSDIAVALEQRLHTLQSEDAAPDAITFSGNGEPTLHPQFAAIVDSVISLRNKYAPRAKVCVLTNATNIAKSDVCKALKKADIAMLKLDAGTDEMLRLINQPQLPITVEKIVAAMQHFGSNIIVQTMFLRGKVGDMEVDNSLQREIQLWLGWLQKLRPSEVAIYTIDRTTPAEHLQKISAQRLQEIAGQVRGMGIKAEVYV